MASRVFALSKVMRDMSKYLAYVVNVGWRNDKSRRSYVSFGNICFEIEFIEACLGKLIISPQKILILRSKDENM